MLRIFFAILWIGTRGPLDFMIAAITRLRSVCFGLLKGVVSLEALDSTAYNFYLCIYIVFYTTLLYKYDI